MTPFAVFHALISLVGIAAGFVVVGGLLSGKRLDGWTSLFLASTAATCVTGFLFPFHGFKPSYAVGVLTLLTLGLSYVARYRRHLAGGWRKAYVVGAMISLYFNVFVLIVQSFMKIPALNALAPTQTEPPFKIAQLTTLVLFVVVGAAATRTFRGEAAP
jgi:hypothetical protein